MKLRRFPWGWLIGSVALLLGPLPIYFGIILKYGEPDGIADVLGFGLVILLMPLGFLSLAILVVYVSRDRNLNNDETTLLNLDNSPYSGG
jgi:hypothetical protein